MADFPHLKLPFKVKGAAKPKGGGNRDKLAKARTNENKVNRKNHGQYLGRSVDALIKSWEHVKEEKANEGIYLPNENDIPVFLKVDTEVFDFDSLKHWGIELIAEEENGFIIGASTDNLQAFYENIDDFLNEKGQRKDKAAQIWELITDDSWRVKELLKGEIGNIWADIQDDVLYTIEIGISCYISNNKKYPNVEDFDSEIKFQEKVAEFNSFQKDVFIERDKKQIVRETEIENYLKIYGGTLYDIWDNEVDAIYFKISISGKGLKDLVQTCQYLFEVKLETKFGLEHDYTNIDDDYDVEIIAPDANAARVCVIDSGIQENHRLIEPSIDLANSRSYVDGDSSTADFVKLSGHGTKVAGAVLYPFSIPKSGLYKFESIIQNARILDRNNKISDAKFAPSLLEQIVSDYPETRIFNLSVAENSAYIGTHMPSLAASIDKLTNENDILFIVAAGNLTKDNIADYLKIGVDYPKYLDNEKSKIANPSVSYFAITVGSIARQHFENVDYKALAGKNYVSPFSRTGFGMWGCIKPDVVEFGGDLLKNKSSVELITNEIISPELVNSTLHKASAVGKDSYGTSFSTPKVSYIASRLQTEHPTESAQMYRALIIQSARLPEHCFYNPSAKDFSYYGYGIPDVNRALNNSTSRITFIQDGKIGAKRADIYRIKIPNQLKGEGKEFRMLVEVTLSFTSKTRLTRKGSHQYLANWLDWQSSKYNESFSSFRNRTLEYLESEEQTEAGEIDEAVDAIKWIIRENPKWGTKGINRNNSTVQKSWVIIEPQQFADEFSIAVIGHSGWDRNLESETPYALCVSFEVFDVEMNIYELLSQAQVEIEPEQEIEI